jgi:uncharacterized membrane protein
MVQEPTPSKGELDAEFAAIKQRARGVLHSLINSIQSKIISGLVLALPIAITFWIFYQIYVTFRRLVLDPIASGARTLIGTSAFSALPPWWDRFAAPLIGILFVLLVLYALGLVARSRLHVAVDWVLYRMPLVTTIYRAVTNVFQSLDRLKRVVLVDFPHPGMRALAFVTNTLRDSDTGRNILSVWVLTGVLPPAGFTLFVPEQDVTELDWTVNQTLQAILSGGITTPTEVPFERGVPRSLRTGSVGGGETSPSPPERTSGEPGHA